MFDSAFCYIVLNPNKCYENTRENKMTCYEMIRQYRDLMNGQHGFPHDISDALYEAARQGSVTQLG